MTPATPARFLLVLAVAWAATEILARLAARVGWTDAARGAEGARKRQRRAVPAVGGTALLLALATAPETLLGSGWPPALAWPMPAAGWRLATLAAVFGLGVWDDRVALRPGAKAAAQLVALLPFALGAARAAAGEPAPWFAALAALGLGFAALNLLNTFDNADGGLSALAALGFALTAPLIAAAVLGFLPLNLDAQRARNRASLAPSAYLGDAGAHVLAYLVLVVPATLGLLVLPALDLARLAVVRVRAGSRPWIGDRRHLAHRLERRGLGSLAVALLQAGIAWPACALFPRALLELDGGAALLGIGGTALLFLLALAWTRAAETL